MAGVLVGGFIFLPFYKRMGCRGRKEARLTKCCNSLFPLETVLKRAGRACALPANISGLMDAAVLLCLSWSRILFVLYDLSLPLAPMFLGLVFTSILLSWLPKAAMLSAPAQGCCHPAGTCRWTGGTASPGTAEALQWVKGPANQAGDALNGLGTNCLFISRVSCETRSCVQALLCQFFKTKK